MKKSILILSFFCICISLNAQPAIYPESTNTMPYKPYFYHYDIITSVTKAASSYTWKVINGKIMDENGNYILSSLDVSDIYDENHRPKKIFVSWDCSESGRVELYKNGTLWIWLRVNIQPSCETTIINETYSNVYSDPFEGGYLNLYNVKVLNGADVEFHGFKAVGVFPGFTAELGSKVRITSFIPPGNPSWNARQRRMATGLEDIADTQISLEQNIPNPFIYGTKISCNVPENSTTSYIQISDMFGRVINKIPTQPGSNEILINGDDLIPGIHVYSLIVDGELVDTKRMVFSGSE